MTAASRSSPAVLSALADLRSNVRLVDVATSSLFIVDECQEALDACNPDGWEVASKRNISSADMLDGSAPDRVHYLNATAAVVFELCTGENSEAEIADLVGTAYGLDEPPQREVASCLDHLQLEGIVR
ncbi:MAG TPA: PqqD family protein [Acidimicrobiia bacterium]|jgi:hypothetical protein